MAQISRIHWTISLLAVTLACSCHGELAGLEKVEYIEMPFQELDYGMRDTGRLYLALKSLDLKPDSSPEFVLDKLREFRDKSDYKLDKEDTDKLIGLADKSDECKYGQYEQFLKAYLTASRTQTIGGAKAILNFLEHYGRSKYSRCASRALAESEKKLKRNAGDLKEINKFFRTALSLPHDSLETTVIKRLREFDLAKSRLDMGKLLLMSEKNLTDRSEGVTARVSAKLRQTCDRLVRSFDMDFNVLNLAMSLNPDGGDYFRGNVELQKLNEVHRICLESESNKSAVYRNMANQVRQIFTFLLH